MENNTIFKFVEMFSKDLAGLALRIEEQIFGQPHAALMQARLYSEELVKMICDQESIEEIFPLKHSERIHKLYRQNAIEEDLYMKLEFIRKKGNKAVHDIEEVDIIDVLQIHKYLYEVSVWYMQVYVSYDFEAPKYQLPLKSADIKTSEKEDIANSLKPYIDQQFQKMDDMWNEINEQLQLLRNEKEKDETPGSSNIKKTNMISNTVKGTLVIKEKSMLYNTFGQNNFILRNETTKAAEFEHDTTKEIVYLLPNKKISIVLNPDTVSDELKTNGKVRFSTALRKFPKEINKGKVPNHYGFLYDFNTKHELDAFLSGLVEA